MGKDERRIYSLISRAYLAQFYPDEQYRSTQIILDIDRYKFKAQGRVDIAPGWKVLFQKDNSTVIETV